MPNLLSSEVELSLVSVLLLEDDSDDIEIISDIIKDISPRTRVVCFDDADNAIHYLKNLAEEEYPSLMILDYNLPKITGIQFIIMLREEEKYNNIPVVMYTTSQLEKHKIEALNLGCKIYSNKKNTVPEIEEDVRKMLSYSRFPLV
jgi:CheY-like chemotaxis protein